MISSQFCKRAVAAAAAAFGMMSLAQAQVFTVVGDPAASATFAEGAGSITIDLTNTLGSAINSVSQAISGISFNVSGWSTADITNLLTTSGNMILVDGSGSKSAYGGADLQWVASYSGSQIYLSIFGGPGPEATILPTQANYASANSSITGNAPHNPFYDGTVELVLSGLTGVNADSKITNVAFNFGTVNGNVVPSIPEPGTYALMLAGLGVVGFMARRRSTQGR